MGGSNPSTCPPPPASAKSQASASASTCAIPPIINPIRSHENTARNEMDFHDDAANLKCAVPKDRFLSMYHAWRGHMETDLLLVGGDGKGGRATVRFTPYIDDNGKMQIAQNVQDVDNGQTVDDMDTLAGY